MRRSSAATAADSQVAMLKLAGQPGVGDCDSAA